MKKDSLYVPDEQPIPYDTQGKEAYSEHQQKTKKACETLEKMQKEVK